VGGLTLPKPKVTIKQRLWAIFAQGYDKTSDEAIKVAPKYKTRKEYWMAWQDARMPGYVGRPVVEAEADTTAPPQQPQGSEANADTKPASSGSTTRFGSRRSGELCSSVCVRNRLPFWTLWRHAWRPQQEVSYWLRQQPRRRRNRKRGHCMLKVMVWTVAPKYRTRKEYWRRWQNAGMPGYVGKTIVEAEPDTTMSPQGSEADTGKSASILDVSVPELDIWYL